MKKKMFSVIIALMPILASYRSIIPNVDLGTFLVLLLLAVSIIRKGKLIIGEKDYFFPVFLYILIFTPLSILANSNASIMLPSMVTAILRWGKFVIAFLLPMSASFKEYYSEQVALKTVQLTSYLAVALVIIQRVAYAFGLTLINPLSNLAINDAYSIGNYTMMAGEGLFRPSAFFLEPSHFTQYIVFYLIFVLFAGEHEVITSQGKSKIIEAVALMVGMFCTGSGMGFALSVAIFVIYIVINSKRNILECIILLAVATIVFALLYKTSFVQSVLERIFTDGASYGGNAVMARIGDGYQLYSELPLLNKLVGLGYGHIPVNVYLNGLSYCLIALGLTGTALFLVCLIRMYKGNSLWKKISLVVFFTMIVFAQLFTPASLLFAVVLLNNNLRLNKSKE